jgi:hypothetical protein
MYLPNGYMSVHMMTKERRPFASGDHYNGTFEEYAEAGKSYIGYCGTYTIRENAVIHHVDVNYFPNHVGVDHVHNVTLDSDKLALTPPPRLVEGVQQTTHITFQKIVN